jgi:ATP-dependent protease ClpP protease subunit
MDEKIYAVDFDGTLCVNEYPIIGEPIQEVIDYVLDLKKEGSKLILWTCRRDDELDQAVGWCSERGIDFDSINENLEDIIKDFGEDTRKVYADHYIDDRAMTVDEIVNGTIEESEVKQMKRANQKKVWELKQSTIPDTLDMYVYGNVESDSYDWWTGQTVESETSADHFRSELAKYPDAKQINIYINSYGGSVYEGTAIYSQLKRHTAQKTVYVDGFACSVASVIAMAADRVVMPPNTMMMIHNMWTCVAGNATELRKTADDLDIMMESNRQVYLNKSNGKITEDRLIELLEGETWLTAQQCLDYGFADEIAGVDADLTDAKQMLQKVNQSMNQKLSYNKAVAAQLREMVQSSKPEPGEPINDPKQSGESIPPMDPNQEPQMNKTKKLMAALFAPKGE